MAKKVTVGSVVKGKDGKPDYIKVRGEHILRDGDFLNLESKASQLASLEKGIESGKISEDFAEKIRERLERIPDFVRFEITKFTE